MGRLSRPVLTTERLRLEPLTVAHTELLVELDSDPEVLRHVFGRALTRDEVVHTWLPRRTRPEADARGLGYWVGHAGDDWLGWWCLALDDDDPGAAELGYRLRRTAWGRGYAREGARALLAHAFETVGLHRVWATTAPDNAGSRRVLEAVGLGLDRLGAEAHYSLTRPRTGPELWDAEAETFDEEPDHGLRDPAVREAWRALLRGVLPGSPSRVADLGCGTGTLTLLLADDGHVVDGVDFSGEMVRRARDKAGPTTGVRFVVGDAADPPLAPALYDVVLCRHVLWALPDPAAALARWVRLLEPGGQIVLVEGSWATGGGLTATDTVALVEAAGMRAELRRLPEAAYWGKEIADERYLVVGSRP